MTWGGTIKKISEIVTLETGDMAQNVFLVLYGPIEGRWMRHHVKKINRKLYF
jgi:hypothetical protein